MVGTMRELHKKTIPYRVGGLLVLAFWAGVFGWWENKLVTAVGAAETSTLNFQLIAERSLQPYGGTPFCYDLDQDGAVDVLWLQSPGLFHSKVYDGHSPFVSRQTPQERQHYCLTATTADGNILWQIGTPWVGDRPYATHGGERSLDVADIDDDGMLEVVAVKNGEILIIDAVSGTIERSVKAIADNAQAVVLARTSNTKDRWTILIKNAESAYPGYEYGNPAWFYDARLNLLKPQGQSHLGSGHIPQSIDLDGDGLDEFLIGFECVNSDLSRRWKFQPVPPETWNAAEMHVDDMTVGKAHGKTVIAYAASDTAYLVDAADGSLLWKRHGTHPQHCQVGRYLQNTGSLQIFIHQKRAELDLYDLAGNQLWQITPQRNFPLGQAAPCQRQKFHVFDPTTQLQETGPAGTDLLIYTDGGWPYVINGHGERCLDFPYTANIAQDWGEIPGRPDDFGYGYFARVADFDGDGQREVMLNDRRFVWFYEFE